MYRIKYLLGSMVAIFSFVYFLFGIVGWAMGDASFRDILVCFVLGSLHVVGGVWMLLSSLREYRRQSQRVDAIMRHLIKVNAGRIIVADLARYAEISEEDARTYLEKRSQNDVAFVLENSQGNHIFLFAHQYWNN
jgi:hypothetical protein